MWISKAFLLSDTYDNIVELKVEINLRAEPHHHHFRVNFQSPPAELLLTLRIGADVL